MGLTCDPGETLGEAYCKRDLSEAVTECAVGLGDESVVAVGPKTIIDGDCLSETYDYYYNIIELKGEYCEAIFSVCLGMFIFMYFAMNNTKSTPTCVRCQTISTP